MRRADVTTHYDHGIPRPAVNVKVYGGTPSDEALRGIAEECGAVSAGFTREYLEELDADWLFEAACESGWEALQANAEEIFGAYPLYRSSYAPRVEVRAEGRSGGWCVVHGLPALEDWDAVMLAKWRKFERWARQEADDIPYQMASLAALNIYLPAEEERLTPTWSKAGC